MKKIKELMPEAYDFNGKLSLKQAIPLGLQHVMAMFVGNLTPLLIITGACGIGAGSEYASIQVALLQNAMIIAGIVTLIQLFSVGPVGGKVPIIMGTSSGFIGVFSSITKVMGGGILAYGAIMGASIMGGLFETVLGAFIKPLRRFFPSVVTGTVVLSIGLSLISVGINSFGGGNGAKDFGSLENLFLAFVVLVVILFVKHWTKGYLSSSSILIGIIVGYIVAIACGMVDFSGVAEAAWFSIPKPIFMIEGLSYSFRIEAIVPFLLVYLATTVETIGDNTGIAVGGLGRDITDDELEGAVHADGFGSVVATLFGVMPNTSFSQNVGLVAMTKIVNRFVLMTGAVFLMLCAFIPKLGAIVASIPNCVLGGAVLLMFAMISIIGLNLLTEEGKISERTGLIVAASCAVGLGLSNCPEVMQHLPSWFQSMFGQAIVGGFVTATILNLILPKDILEKENN